METDPLFLSHERKEEKRQSQEKLLEGSGDLQFAGDYFDSRVQKMMDNSEQVKQGLYTQNLIDKSPYMQSNPGLHLSMIIQKRENKGTAIPSPGFLPAGVGRKILCDKPASVKTGSLLNYHLYQAGAELWPGDKDLSYRWTIVNDHNTSFIDKTSYHPSLQCSAVNPGDYTIGVQIMNKGVPVPGCFYSYQQNIYMEKKNTELGGLSVGNFDFRFDGKEIDISVRVKFKFEKSIAEANQANFKAKFFNAIHSYWGSHGRVLEATTDSGSTFDIPININCTEVTDSSQHKVVDVTKDWRRCKVIDDINVYEAVSEETIAHEFGHVLGLDDEYDGGWLENIMFWHDDGSNHGDTNALMNSGGEMRDRYFNLYKKAVESSGPKGYSYKIKVP